MPQVRTSFQAGRVVAGVSGAGAPGRLRAPSDDGLEVLGVVPGFSSWAQAESSKAVMITAVMITAVRVAAEVMVRADDWRDGWIERKMASEKMFDAV